jgi:hypothetical protein
MEEVMAHVHSARHVQIIMRMNQVSCFLIVVYTIHS